jgi:AmiR/NasT family two-component response regulator
MQELRIIIADDEPIIRMDLKQMLESYGYVVIGEAGDGAQAIELARQLKPDLVILDVRMPELDGIEVARILGEEKIAPALILTAFSNSELINRAKQVGVYAYLVKPFKAADLAPAIEIAISRYQDHLSLSNDASELANQLEIRKIVDRAKGILMDVYGLKEQEAYRRIQIQSMSTRKSMCEVAEAIIIANGV